MNQFLSYVITCVGLLISSYSIANDTVGAMGAGGIEFKKTSDISMEKEVLTISTSKIRVDYQFVNITNHTIKERIYFPTPSNYGGCHTPKNDFNFQLWVNGKETGTTSAIVARVNGVDVTERLRSMGLSDDQIYDLNGYRPCEEDWVPLNKEEEIELKKLVDAGFVKMIGKYPSPLWNPSEVSFWDQEFPPGQVINISHEYAPVIGTDSGNIDFLEKGFGIQSTKELADRLTKGSNLCIDDGTFRAAKKAEQKLGGSLRHAVVDYVLKTGANWSGPIKDFTLNLTKASPTDVVSLCFDGNFRKTSPLVLSTNKKNFVPDQDLSVLFLYYDSNYH